MHIRDTILKNGNASTKVKLNKKQKAFSESWEKDE